MSSMSSNNVRVCGNAFVHADLSRQIYKLFFGDPPIRPKKNFHKQSGVCSTSVKGVSTVYSSPGSRSSAVNSSPVRCFGYREVEFFL
jgi:hypothetical protein